MTQDAQAWLDANTFFCDRLRARITPAQCEANRSRPETAEVTESGPGPTLQPACKDCPRAAEPQPKENKAMSNTHGTCGCCGREGNIQAKGLDSLCYTMSRRKDIKPRPDGRWDIVSDEALERINEARLSAGMAERGKSADEPTRAAKAPTASEIMAQREEINKDVYRRKEAAQGDFVVRVDAETLGRAAPAAPEMRTPTGELLRYLDSDDPPPVLELDGLALPLVRNDRNQPSEPYLLVSRSLKLVEVPMALSRLLPEETKAVFIYAQPKMQRLYLVPTSGGHRDAKPLCAKKKGSGRQVYCEGLLKHLAIKPGHYPAEATDQGVIVVRLDKELAA